jgi:glyoxylate utilization-related uncharacterized protein
MNIFLSFVPYSSTTSQKECLFVLKGMVHLVRLGNTKARKRASYLPADADEYWVRRNEELTESKFSARTDTIKL